MEKSNVKDIVDSLVQGFEKYFTSKTVVGEPIRIDDTIVIPLVDISFGIGAGNIEKTNRNNGGGGMGANITPSAMLVINKGQTKLINIKQQDEITKILNMVPDIIDKFKKNPDTPSDIDPDVVFKKDNK